MMIIIWVRRWIPTLIGTIALISMPRVHLTCKLAPMNYVRWRKCW
ncbi:hypothetical protein LINPERHAP1_LOCUS8712 [Linum perenne]